ncbi:MAG: all-trans-retinol 13,14-reductase, partial [Candidatus Rokubacteria bacterium]|nr:all-trans-retinol 13,14-reductase [Candidatus Rokubacteria bacterium]
MTKRRSGGVGIFLGFAPWIAYWVLSGSGLGRTGVAVGLAAALGLCAWQIHRGRARVMELTAAAFFATHAVVTLALGSAFLRTYDPVLASGTLAAMAWGTLLAGSPFTAQYAREDWPREYWDAPLFRRTNAMLTGLWGFIFTANAGLGALSLIWPTARLWLVAILPQIGIGVGVALSIALPRWYPRWSIAREIAARDPYRWPAPSFGFARPSDKTQHDVIVIGAGIGGLTAAALLAKR